VRELSQSYYCGASDRQIIYETIGNYLDRICDRFPQGEALVVRHQGVRRTWREFQREIEDLAAGLLALGLQPGDRVGIWGPNSHEWMLVQYATAKMGAIMVCINPAYRLHELEYALNRVECRAIVSAERFRSSQYLEMLQQLAPELGNCAPGKLRAGSLPQLETVIRMGEGATPGMFNFAGVCAWVQLHPWEEMSAEALREFCREQISHYKIPRYVRFVEEYPMTVTGKIQKYLMRQQMRAELAGKGALAE
jgi:fatty-acyl-CoA synthase